MSSIIEGYNYDIFISYRQKDNKYDGWVTEFVDNLTKELEATFKEEISLYFDINPHDGLLETHDVDASLKDKLRCLIFIPIISRTYCDPKSFAWEHEFKAFAEFASQDQFGLKVKLPNGNVASRIIPIRIHDLDNNDIKECESVLGSVIRGVEFIYREPGVNRSLTPKDNENKNLSKTNYRNQINKVALTIKEIIASLGQPEQTPKVVSKKTFEPVSVPKKSKKAFIIAGSIILLALIILGCFLIPKLFTSKKELEKSIVVLPFKDLTGKPEQDYLVQGQNDALISELGMISQVKPLRVISGQTASVIAKSSRSIPEISKEINVDYIVEGSVLKVADSISIQLRLIKALPDEKLIWTKRFNSDIINSQKLYNNLAGQIAGEIGFDLTADNTASLPIPRKINPSTYATYLRGMYYLNQSTDEGVLKGIEYFNEVLKTDPADPFAYAGLAFGYITIAHGTFDKPDALEKAEAAANRAIKLDTTMAEAYGALAVVEQYDLWQFEKAEKDFKKALTLNPNLAIIHYHYSWALHLLGRDDEAIVEHKLAKKYDPFNPLHTAWMGGLYFCKGQYDDAVRVALESFEIQKDYPVGYFILGLAYREMGRTDEAINAHKKLAELYPEWLWALGYTYAYTNHRKEAEKILSDIESQPIDPYNAYCRIVINAALGKKDEAFKWLAYKPHHAWTAWVAVEPWFNGLHGDPRFDEWVKELNLPKK